jgi:hypothetical protein
MYEIARIVQDDEHLKKRWFNDPVCDLIIWENHQNVIEKFQFYYRKVNNEFMVEWNLTHELQYAQVDSGDGALKNFSPVLVRGKKQNPDDIVFFFVYRSIKLDEKIKNFVIEKLKTNL